MDYAPTTRPGARLPHLWLAPGVSSYDRLGPGFTLVRVGSAPDCQDLVAAAGAAAIPLVVLDLDAEVVGNTWEEVPLLLVRPDQHVAWRSRSAPDREAADHLLRRVTGRGAAAPTVDETSRLGPS